jgi:ATP-dependent 26S proteasome regulatory subunit
MAESEEDIPTLPPFPDSLYQKKISDLEEKLTKSNETLAKTGEALEKYQEFEKIIGEPPLEYAVVNHIGLRIESPEGEHSFEDMVDSAPIEAGIPKIEYGVAFNTGEILYVSALDELTEKIVLGSPVLVERGTATISRMAEKITNYLSANVEEILEDDGGPMRVRVKTGRTEKIIVSGVKDLKRGDNVGLDMASTVVLENYGTNSDRYFDAQTPDLTWDAIAGQDDVIAEIRRDVVRPFMHPEIYEKFPKKDLPKGILLYGHSGVGKTMLGKALANEIGASKFLYLAGSELRKKFVGEGEAMIKSIFAEARQYIEETGKSVVLFLDEAEELKHRGSGISSDASDPLTGQWLKEMDGVAENKNLLVVMATNRQDIIDSAVLREERVNRKIEVGRPDKAGIARTIEMYLEGSPLKEGDAKTMAHGVTELIYAAHHPIVNVTYEDQTKGVVLLSDVVSGAMAKAIYSRAVDFAVDDAFNDDSGKLQETPGISDKNLADALESVYFDVLPNVVTPEDYKKVARKKKKALLEIKSATRANSKSSENVHLGWGKAVKGDPSELN